MNKSSLDDVDRRIISELMKNARITYRELAKLLNLTDVAIIKRIRKLEQTKVVKKYTTIVDPNALGYSKISYTGINVKPEKLFDVVKTLKEKTYIKYLALTSGDHDVLAVIWASSASELEKIHEEIKNLDGVLSVYPMILSEVVKDEAYI
ncbi:MAG: Lrp/AsnC family transcriptional regulator [Desulfurococcaceae archaeon]